MSRARDGRVQMISSTISGRLSCGLGKFSWDPLGGTITGCLL